MALNMFFSSYLAVIYLFIIGYRDTPCANNIGWTYAIKTNGWKNTEYLKNI